MNKLQYLRRKSFFFAGICRGGGTECTPNKSIQDIRKPPTSYTIKAYNETLNQLPFKDTSDFEDASRGLIAKLDPPCIKTESGKVAWDISNFDFVKQGEPSPYTINPSLWRQAQLNNYIGLFKVQENVFQIRGLDIANMTIIEGEGGLIVIDPLVSQETAKAGMDLYYANSAQRLPIVAVVTTHSHIDHFGGIEGIISQEEVDTNKVEIYAPLGWQEHAISENVYAGNAMRRRATYQYGAFLKFDEKGVVDSGIGKTNSLGTQSIMKPTHLIGDGKENKVINKVGIDIEFQYTPNTEAPAEMNLYFPQWKLLLIAENAPKTLHNILTLRGAQIRDALNWSNSIAQTMDLYGDKVETLIAQHNWPTWGNAKIIDQLKHQRDLYKFIHDQSLYLLNKGYKPIEIANKIKLPDSLAKKWYNRGYYGALKVNCRAVYQKYLGWYDGNPTNLDPLPPSEASKKFVEYIGNSDKIIAKARQDFDKGEYRWVAQVMNTVVNAEPHNMEARLLEADALEQLGYQSENGPWRNEYLMAAQELRIGMKNEVKDQKDPSFIETMTIAQIFDTLSTHLNASRADNFHIVINWDFTDINEQYLMTLENSVIHYKKRPLTSKADVTLILTQKDLANIANNTNELQKNIRIQGNAIKFQEFLQLFDKSNLWFNIMTPVDSWW